MTHLEAKEAIAKMLTELPVRMQQEANHLITSGAINWEEETGFGAAKVVLTVVLERIATQYAPASHDKHYTRMLKNLHHF